MIRTFLSFKTKLYAKNYHISATLGGMIDNRPFVAFNCQRRIFRALIVAMMGAINSLMVEIIRTSDGNTFLVFSSNVRKHKIVVIDKKMKYQTVQINDSLEYFARIEYPYSVVAVVRMGSVFVGI